MRSLPLILVLGLLAFAASAREISIPFPADASPAIRHFGADIACAGDQCLAVWSSWNDGLRLSHKIRGARIDKTGKLLDTISFEIANVTTTNNTMPQVVALDSDYVVFYAGFVYARVSRDGVVTTRDAATSVSSPMSSVVEAITVGGRILLYAQENRGPLIPSVTLLDTDLKVVRELKIDGQPNDIAVSGNGFVVSASTVDGLTVSRIAIDGSITTTASVPVYNASPVMAATTSGVLLAWRRASTNTTPATTEFAVIGFDGKSRLGVLDKALSAASSLDVASNGSEYLALWTKPSSGYYSDQLFARRISADGEVLDSAPVRVGIDAPPQLMGKVAFAGGNYVALWSDWRYGSGHDHVFGATLSASGQPASDFLVSRLLISQSKPALATAGDVVGMAWAEGAAGEPGAAKFTRTKPDGTLLDATPVTLSAAAWAPSITSRGDKIVVAFREFNSAQVAIVSPAGAMIVSGRISFPGIGPISVTAGNDTILLVCENGGTILAGQIRYDGTVVDPTPRGILSGSNPAMAFDGSDYWIVSTMGGALQAQRLALDLTFVDAQPFTIAPAGDGAHDQVAMACGSDTCVALWRTVRDNGSTIDGALLHKSGAVPGIVAARGNHVAQPALAWNGNAYVATWSDREIRSTQLSSNGNLAGVESTVTGSNADEQSPTVSVVGGLRVFAFTRTDHLILYFDEEVSRRRSVRH